MPSYPIRPTFPVDVRSTASIAVSREGTTLRFELNPAGALGALGPSRSQFFAALEAMFPGAVSTLAAAVPASPGDSINRAFNGTSFVTAGSALVVFSQATLGLTDAQVASVLAQAAALPN